MLKVNDYGCGLCGSVFERFTKGHEKVLCKCGAQARKMIGAPMVKFERGFEAVARRR